MKNEYDLRNGSIKNSLNQFNNLEQAMEEDKDRLDELMSEMSSLRLVFRSGNLGGESDTEKILGAYERIFHDMEGRTDIQDLYSQLPVSPPASGFMAELTNIASLTKEQAYEKARFLDGENNITKSNYNELVIYFESFKQVRNELSKDIDGERESLRDYSNRIDDMSEDLVKLSEENPFEGLDVAEAGNILEELEQYKEKIGDLKRRRVQEIERRPDIYDGLAESNFVKTYRKATGSNTPVIDELDHLQSRVDEAYDTVVSAF